MQHSLPHMNVYRDGFFLSWGGRILSKVESVMVILLSVSLAYFVLPSSVRINIRLCSSLAETLNNNSGPNYLF